MQGTFLFPTIQVMTILILWTITILGLSGLFLLFHAPFLGAFFLLLLLAVALIVSHQQRQAGLPPILWIYPKIGLALLFLACIGYSLYLYLNSIQCLSCMHGILSANLPVSLSYARQNLLSFAKGLWAFNNRVSFFFLFMSALMVIYTTVHIYQKKQKKGRRHA